MCALTRRVIGILISTSVQNLCVMPISCFSHFPVQRFITEGRAPSTEDPFQNAPSVDSNDFPFAQLIEFSSDLSAPMKIMLKLVI